MLKVLRKNEFVRNLIIVGVCLAMAAYVLVGLGSAPPLAQSDLVTTIGSTKIKVRDWNIQRETMGRQYRQFSANLEPGFIDNQAARTLLSKAVALDSADHAGIRVSPDELRDVVIAQRTYPDGSFVAEEDYQRFIKQSYQMQVPTYEAFLKENELRFYKFQSLMTSSSYVGDQEIEEEFVKDGKKVKIEMIVLNTYDVSQQVNLKDDSALRDFFDQNKDAFKTGPQRRIQYVSFPTGDYVGEVQITEADLQKEYDDNSERYRKPEQVGASHILIKTDQRSEEEALVEITKVKAELEGGLAFDEAAKQFSEDSSASKGGDLGLFGRGKMVPPFEAAVFALEMDAVSEPVKSQFGYHIIKKTGYQEARVQPLAEVSANIEATLKRTRAKDQAKTRAEELITKINSGTAFADAAKEMSFEIKVSDPFDNDNFSNMGGNLNRNYQARRAAFALTELNEVTPVVDAGNLVMVAQWVSEEEPSLLSFENDKSRIQNMSQKIAGKTFIQKALADIKTAAQKDPEKALKDLKGSRDYLKDNHFKTTELVNTIPFELRREEMDFDKDIYTLAEGDFVEGTHTQIDTRYVLARIVEKQEPDMEKLGEERIAIAERLRAQRGNELFSSLIFERQKALDPDRKKETELMRFVGVR